MSALARQQSSLSPFRQSRRQATTPSIRSVTDAERERAAAFCARHPEFEKLGHDALMQVAGTYRDLDDHAVIDGLRGTGAECWHRVESDDVNPLWSDEQ